MRRAIDLWMLIDRQKVLFASGGSQRAAWHYA